MSDERSPNSLPLRKARNSTTGHVVRKRATTTYGPASSPVPGGAPADPTAAQGHVSPSLNDGAGLGQGQTWGTAWPPRYTPMPPPQVPPPPSAPPGSPSMNGTAQSYPPTYQPPADP